MSEQLSHVQIDGLSDSEVQLLLEWLDQHLPHAVVEVMTGLDASQEMGPELPVFTMAQFTETMEQLDFSKSLITRGIFFMYRSDMFTGGVLAAEIIPFMREIEDVEEFVKTISGIRKKTGRDYRFRNLGGETYRILREALLTLLEQSN